MKKCLAILMIAIVALTGLFVSCSNDIDTAKEQSRSIRFTSGDEIQSKGLTSSLQAIRTDDYYWTYTAQKADASGLETGATAEEFPVTRTVAGDAVTHEKGLGGIVGPFSLGKWNFTLNAYTASDLSEKVYSGSIQDFVLTKDTSVIRVSVDPQASQANNGKLVVPEIPLEGLTGEKIEVITITNLDTKAKSVYDSDPSTDIPAIPEDRTFVLASGLYKINIVFKSVDTDPVVEYSNNNAYANVYDFLTTEIGGNMDEITTSTRFESVSGAVLATSPDITVIEGKETNLVVDSSPAQLQGSTVQEEKTKVSIPAGGLSANSKANVAVTSYKAPEANGKYKISTQDGVVAAIDIVVTEDSVKKSEFGGEAITVITYVAKDLPGQVSVIYQDDTAEAKQPTDVTYDPVTGKLTFKTTHLSEFYVIADIEAMNMNTGVPYASILTAASEAKPGETVVITKDIKADKTTAVQVNGAIIDGLWHKVSGDINFNLNDVNGGTIKHVKFYDISNASNKLSPIYARLLKGTAIITDNEFHASDWDSIQIIPNPGAHIVIENNFFEHKPTPGADVEQTPNRYIHIESKNVNDKYTDIGEDFSASIKGNIMYDCIRFRNTGIEVYWPTNPEKIEISDNYIDAPFAVCIRTSYEKPIPEIVLPFATGPNGEPSFDPEAYYEKAGNYFFTATFDEAIDKAVAANSKFVGIVKDVTTEKTLPAKIKLYTNGHQINSISVNDVNELVRAYQAGAATIKLNADLDLGTTFVPVDRSIRLDLNGHKITFQDVNQNRPIHIQKPNLNIELVSTNGKGEIFMNNMTKPNLTAYGIIDVRSEADNTNLLIDGVKLSGHTDNGALLKVRSYGSNITIRNTEMVSNVSGVVIENSKVLIEDSVFINDTKPGGPLSPKGASVIFLIDCDDAVIRDTRIETQSNTGIQFSDSTTGIVENCNILVNNANVENHSFLESPIAVAYGSTMDVEGGTYKSSDYGAYVFSSGGTININSGTIEAGFEALRGDTSIATWYRTPAIINVNGGTITGDARMNPSIDGAEEFAATVNFHGGEYNGKLKKNTTTTVKAPQFVIDGGTFLQKPDASYLREGYELVGDEQGPWTVQEKVVVTTP